MSDERESYLGTAIVDARGLLIYRAKKHKGDPWLATADHFSSKAVKERLWYLFGHVYLVTRWKGFWRLVLWESFGVILLFLNAWYAGVGVWRLVTWTEPILAPFALANAFAAFWIVRSWVKRRRLYWKHREMKHMTNMLYDAARSQGMPERN